MVDIVNVFRELKLLYDLLEHKEERYILYIVYIGYRGNFKPNPHTK